MLFYWKMFVGGKKQTLCRNDFIVYNPVKSVSAKAYDVIWSVQTAETRTGTRKARDVSDSDMGGSVVGGGGIYSVLLSSA